MATIPPGGIVTVPDGGGGAGAAVTTTEIINAMWQNAQNKSSAGTAYTNAAVGYSDPAPHMTGAVLDTSYLPPVKPVLADVDPNDSEAMYNAQRDQMLALITDNFASFINEWFPHPEWYEDALGWCHEAFTAGGSGINSSVEQQLWERARARILADSERAKDEVATAWANRRFPLPPGALTNQTNQISLDAGRKLAESSRDIAIKSFDTEIENVRFAVTKVLDQRKIALDATGDYIKTIMLAPDTAMKLATGLANIRTELSRSLVQLYSAEVAAAEPRIRLAITDAQLRQGAAEANLRSDMNSLENKVRAFMAAAQMLGSQASAGLNAINAQSSISGTDSSSV